MSTSSSAFDYRGKTVFIAGGTSGINFGIAQGFARAGARLAVLSRSQDKVDAAVASLKELGGEVRGYAADVRDYEAVETALKAAAAELGLIDVLISGAAGNFPAPALGMSAKGFKTVIDIDLLGSFHVLRAGYALLNKPGAAVINISAPQAYNAMEFQMHVCAAKAGVDMLTRVAAIEWGAAGVRVNSVVPGPIANTEGMRRLAPTPETEALVRGSVPMGCFGEVEDIANCCLWLASPMARYVSGAVIPVDGGWSLGGTSITAGGMKQALLAP
ncbi:MAG: SDR family oxidoreductase [Stagnimonas sp.]|nr:SDR family oxidoreductase [Stagnimonas sp.]